jgi:hypothetical protein
MINLNRVRKDRERRNARARADANAASFGLSKAERALAAACREDADSKLDAHRRDRPEDAKE